MIPCALRAQVDRHFAGTIAPPDERVLRQHLPGCDACRAYYARHLVLAGLDPAALPGEERLGRGLGLGSVRRRLGLPWVAAALAAAAAVVLVMRASSPAPGFVARGGVLPPPQQPCRLYVYDVPPGAAPSLAGASVGAGDELAFAYENGAGRSRIMVFGVDEHRHVYWFYPAYTRADEDPVAVPIATDARRHPLPDAVRHRFDGARISVRALFVDAPVTVHQVETLLETQPAGPLPLEHVDESATSFSIAP